jgi:hydroxymethylglutaryl-CoA lyase
MDPSVTIVEVGARDGLQNESQPVSLDVKLALIERLADAGLTTIEATAFVSPRWVPQMADHAELMRRLPRRLGVSYPVLVPNMQGLREAIDAGARDVAVFAAASESFSQRNINCSIAQSIERFEPVLQAASAQGVRVRGYVSCALGCPYEGAVEPAAVARVAQRLHDLGCDEISLGDTIGAGNPAGTRRMLQAVLQEVPRERIAGHFHDTFGMAVANVLAAYECGVRVFDSSVGGLGGCPYAPGAAGNVATESLVYLFDGLGVHTGVSLERLVDCTQWIFAQLGRETASPVALAMLAQRRRS